MTAMEQLEKLARDPTQDPRAWLRGEVAESLNLLGLIRLGHEGMMLDKINRQRRIVENGVRAYQRGETTVSAEDQAVGEDMGVNVGNTIHYHMEQPATPPAQPTVPVPTASPPTPATPAQPSTLQKYGLPALIAALGIGGTALGYWLGNRPTTNTTNTSTTITKPGDDVSVLLKLPPPSKP